MTNWFNTINFDGEDLKRENAKAAKQEELILALFKANPNHRFSPDQIHDIFAKKYNLYPPITSIRRAITNLTNRFQLMKTDEMVAGKYHLPTHTWCYGGTIENLYTPTQQSAGDHAIKIITQGDLFSNWEMDDEIAKKHTQEEINGLDNWVN